MRGDDDDAIEGEAFGPYRIVRRLAVGRTSDVLLAVAHGPCGFARRVVVKRLHRTFERDPDARRTLVSEAIASARLSHPAIVRLYDVVSLGDRLALVLEHVDGPSLARLRAALRVMRARLDDPAACFVASRVFAALEAAHAARDPRTRELAPVIHRDVSPANVLVPWDGFVKLGDFGVAKLKGVSPESRVGVLKGTYGYMAPEQVLGEAVTPRTDVYLGCLLLRELLVGRAAFAVDALPELELLGAMADARLAPIESLRPGISPRLADALRRGLTRDPEERALTAGEMVRILRAEHDLDQGHAALVALLAGVRAREPRTREPPRSTPPSGTPAVVREALARAARHATDAPPSDRLQHHTPRPMMLSSIPEAAPSTPRELARARGRRAYATAAGAALLATSAAIWCARGAIEPAATSIATPPSAAPSSRAAAGPSTIAQPASSPASASPLSAARAAPDAASAPTMGDVITPARLRAHRVFVDGRFAAPHAGVTLHLACGRHAVRIGSRGVVQSIVVPCGDAITLE